MQPLMDLLDQIAGVNAINNSEKGVFLKKHKVFPYGVTSIKKLKSEYGETKCPICEERMPRGFYFFKPDFNEYYVQDDKDFWLHVGKIVREGSVTC